MQEFSLLLLQCAAIGNLWFSIPLQQHDVLEKVVLDYNQKS